MNKTPQAKEIISQSILRLKENNTRISKCLAELTEAEVWQRPNDSLNSVGNLILHLCGNITQYIVSSLGENVDRRARDEEFTARGGLLKEELLLKLENTVENAIEVISRLDDEELLNLRSVQGFEYSGIGNIIHVVEHYSYHTGQIAFWTKLLKDKDLEFYAGIDLNVKNITK